MISVVEIRYVRRSELTASLLTWQTRPTSFQGKMKTRLDSLSGCSGYVLHDFRRYLASRMAALGVPLPTVEYLLAHRSHSFSGIVSVYQKHNWLAEMREAVAKYESFLQSTGVG